MLFRHRTLLLLNMAASAVIMIAMIIAENPLFFYYYYNPVVGLHALVSAIPLAVLFFPLPILSFGLSAFSLAASFNLVHQQLTGRAGKKPLDSMSLPLLITCIAVYLGTAILVIATEYHYWTLFLDALG